MLKTPMKISHRLLASIFVTVLMIASQSADCFSQQQTGMHVRSIAGSRMVVGDGDVPDYAVDCFLYLCRDAAPNIVVINLEGEPRIASDRWKNRGADSVTQLNRLPTDFEALTVQLLNADGVWIEGNPERIVKHALLLSLLKNTTKRDGVIAVDSSAVSLLSKLDDNDEAKRLASPFATCEFHFGGSAPAKNGSKDSPLKVHWLIPNSSTAVVHTGRRIAGYGNQDIRLMVKQANGLPKQERAFECLDVFGPGGYPGYGQDLFAWVRAAKDRSRPAFPPKEAGTPVVENGTLFLHGGSRLHQDVLKEFVKLTGGKDASFVCIPSAKSFDRFEEPNSYMAENLRELGCDNVTVLHTADPFVADQSKEFARILKNADGVWIDGGRTFRFMDSYEGTQVPKLLAGVLDRGGVVGGSSAGCQVPSDFLVRGNPTSNRDIEYDGYTRGMGLLKGVIIDAHFLQRGRHEPFLGLMKKYPQMLGIGIDESTALIVDGGQGRVVGNAAVSFYDLTATAEDDFKPVILKAGQSYDLKLRKSAGEKTAAK